MPVCTSRAAVAGECDASRTWSSPVEGILRRHFAARTFCLPWSDMRGYQKSERDIEHRLSSRTLSSLAHPEP
jgi:hypothetical protein